MKEDSLSGIFIDAAEALPPSLCSGRDSSWLVGGGGVAVVVDGESVRLSSKARDGLK